MWLVIVGALAAFFMAYGIGANDVANSFGTSVGAKTLTLAQACCIAAIFEFAGAIGLGGEVAKTIAGSIARPAAFQNNPELFAYGMMCSLIAAGTWVIIATYFCLAVSTTHAVVGAVMGFALVWGGKGAVVWNDHKPEFPYSNGLVPVICSWFVSPVTAGIASSILFFLNRIFVLRRERSTTFAIWVFPVLVYLTVFINVFFVIYKGAKSVAKWSPNKSAWVAAVVAAGAFALAVIPGTWLLRRKVARDMEEAAQKAADAEANTGKPKTSDDGAEAAEDGNASKAMQMFNSLKRAATHGLRQDIHEKVESDRDFHDLHAAAEVFSPETEQVYKYLQVFSACAVSFAHGSNDVANAIGPFSGIWHVYKFWNVSSNGETPVWVLALGGAGIVVGLATYGYNIIQTLGVGLAKMTPARGYCAELAAGITISIASVYGLPVSTTQIITGGELGVGLVENIRTGVNWKLLAKQLLGWVFTLIVAGFLCAALFAYGAYAPSLTMAKDIAVYQNTMRAAATNLNKLMNVSNYAVGATFPTAFDKGLNSSINSNLKTLTNMFNTKTIGYVDPYQLGQQLNTSIATYLNQSVTVTGFNRSSRAYVPAGAAYPDTTIQVQPNQ
ncbi:hypothetical protein CHLRE_16g655200v5 [Chlamydomonas reinhardtii]|uniref:Phosphate transporter n=2 Tax=Chlamydomonas reinhardtii TaxID=3055 RepID=A0A2K3CT43_CHLRE|nr:uncharacterized protein CHLRE_16g655200v5 [Chlamydomonas reinhardtii]PNW71457.1 hypothetical protein CHLRE_16g655200v5 [Chlamydomonas reinhardtii]